MAVYIIIYCCIFIVGVFNSRKKKYSRLVSCLFLTVLLSLVMGLRSIDYAGVDTIVYARDFERIVDFKISFSQIFSEFYKDYFFYLSAKLFSLVCTDENIWILFCSVVYIAAVSWLIYKYSPSIWLSYLIFVGWDFYVYNFQLIRHTCLWLL